ncbi:MULTISPECIES: DUF1149 family protein [Enterococcus]|uniref:Uncharacterized protein n=1 Tax=Enterococcus malodoratus ATCC 43197 TaxID=1158601 RepID=R2PEE8_9ENTE|nr:MULTISPECIES: DUF1149 family protein [Enterococcus]EOH82742.1 hypothetical protein UAI_00137 [Enterococcus malodoratus ATCC 43197]EOT70558.1 hypothetical protein I585_00069 [Enterococcus malodoratus ATCC 43197]OJG64502.1 hypothetical protein RV07_GL004204 [Enterococcus malodoratus]SET04172.1 hypothetical protein SAMN04487821_105125 [Enterococcus malodoratus]SPW86695.1 protein of hypothetical function [Enterococcus malodoratus]
MEIQRDQEVVESFNYGLPPKDQVVKQKLLINFSPLEAMDPGYPAENSIMGVRIEFVLPFEDFIIGGVFSQVIHVIGRQVKQQNDLTEAEANEMIRPILKLIERMVYEITEIALDKPGVKINFSSNTI